MLMSKKCIASQKINVVIISLACCSAARATVISPISSNLVVALDGSSTLVDAGSKLKVWYDQIGTAQAEFQDFGVQSATFQPTLQTGVTMPNGTLHNVVDFLGNAGGTTGSRLE